MKKMSKQFLLSTKPFILVILALFGCEKDEINGSKILASINWSSQDFLVDGNGQALYIFALDVDGSNNCNALCW